MKALFIPFLEARSMVPDQQEYWFNGYKLEGDYTVRDFELKNNDVIEWYCKDNINEEDYEWELVD